MTLRRSLSPDPLIPTSADNEYNGGKKTEVEEQKDIGNMEGERDGAVCVAVKVGGRQPELERNSSVSVI